MALLAVAWAMASVSSCMPRVRLPTLEWDDPIEVAAGPAERGPWQMNESNYRWVDDPSVSILTNGDAAVAWVDQSRKDVFLQCFGREGHRRFQTDTNVSRSPQTFSWLPRVAHFGGEKGGLYLLWQEIVFSGGTHGGEIFFARSSDLGRDFEPPKNLSNSRAGDGKGRLSEAVWDNGSLDLAIGPTGSIYAVWTEYEGALWFRSSDDGGHRFSDAVRVGGSWQEPARGPSLAVNDLREIYVAWAVGEEGPRHIQLARSADAGRSFVRAQGPCPDNGKADAPKIAFDRAGTLHLAYAESASGTAPYRIRYGRLGRGQSRFEACRIFSGPKHTQPWSSHFPNLDLDGGGGVYLVWELYSKRRARPDGLVFTYSLDGGKSFATDTTLSAIASATLGDNGSQQGSLSRKLAVSGTRDLAVVNSSFKAGVASRVRVLRGRVQ